MTLRSDETDEMKIKLLESLGHPDSDDKLYPPELNEHLLEQLKITSSANNELRNCIFCKDQEIKELNKTVTDLNQRIRDIISGTGPAISSKSAGIISAKITDLCKQNRHLVAEVESFKTKNSCLERKLMEMKILISEKEEDIKKSQVCLCKIDPDPDEVKELNNKLANVNKKLLESKHRNSELKNEVIMATKVLQKELGSKFTNLRDLHNDINGWKGRAQQITLLQARITELEEKLNGKQKEEKETRPSIKSQQQIIKELEIKKKKEIEQTMKSVESVKDENQDLKKKLEAARARIRNLECDCLNLRQKMQTFAEKSKHDDMLINEQREQIKTTELYYQELLKDNNTKIKKMKNEIDEYEKEFSNTDAKIDALRKQTFEKSTKIDELRAQLLRYEKCSLQSVFFTPMKTATDNEILQLTELVKTLNERLNVERQKFDELDTVNRKLKESKKRMERKISILNENIVQLNSRKLSRSRCTLTKDQVSSNYVLMQKTSEFDKSQPTDVVSSETLDKDDLRFRLELTEEKLKIIQDKLKMIEEEKVEDYNKLTDMLQNSQRLFNEALSVLQKEKCHCH